MVMQDGTPIVTVNKPDKPAALPPPPALAEPVFVAATAQAWQERALTLLANTKLWPSKHTIPFFGLNAFAILFASLGAWGIAGFVSGTSLLFVVGWLADNWPQHFNRA